MYRHFFGLCDHPFSLNPDPRYLFLTAQIQSALDTLIFGIQARKGLVLLTGEVGTGKTTLINRLLGWLQQQRTPTAFISNPHLEPHHLFDLALADFRVSSSPWTISNSRILLEECLLEHCRAGKTSVLIVDEAQGLSVDLLEEIRLLLNLETPREKLLQAVLVGQPEIEDKLTRHELRQLQQRIALRCKIGPLSCDETRAYIHARLRIAGAAENSIFEPEAVDALHSYARGIPRVINLLSEYSLMSAYARNLQPVPAGIIDEAARAFQLDNAKPPVRQTDSTDATTAQLTSMKSNLVSVPIVVPSPTMPAQSKPDPPSLGHEDISVRAAFAEALRKETEPFLGSNEFTSEDAFRLLGDLALKSQALASAPTADEVKLDSDPPALSHRETSPARLVTSHTTTQTLKPNGETPGRRSQTGRIGGRTSRVMHWPVIDSLVQLTQVITTWLQSFRSVTNLVPVIDQTWLAWRGRFPTTAFGEITAALIRWLQEPFGQVSGGLQACEGDAYGRAIGRREERTRSHAWKNRLRRFLN